MSGTFQITNTLQAALHRVTETPEFKRVVDEIKRGARVISLSGLVAGSARALALAALQRETGQTLCDCHAIKPGSGAMGSRPAFLVLRSCREEALRKTKC